MMASSFPQYVQPSCQHWNKLAIVKETAGSNDGKGPPRRKARGQSFANNLQVKMKVVFVMVGVAKNRWGRLVFEEGC